MSTFQLYYCVSGGTRYQVDGTEYELAPGSLLSVCPGERLRHLAAEGERYEFITVKFTGKWASELTQTELLPLMLRYRFRRSCGATERALLAELASPAGDEAMRSRVCMAALLWKLSEAALPQKGRAPLTLAERIVSYVTEHALSLNSTQQLLQRFRISRATLFRLFRQQTGQPLWGFIRRHRLTAAKIRIDAGEKPTDACLRCGFSDYSSFSAAYRKQYGVSPKTDHRKAGK